MEWKRARAALSNHAGALPRSDLRVYVRIPRHGSNAALTDLMIMIIDLELRPPPPLRLQPVPCVASAPTAAAIVRW